MLVISMGFSGSQLVISSENTLIISLCYTISAIKSFNGQRGSSKLLSKAVQIFFYIRFSVLLSLNVNVKLF